MKSGLLFCLIVMGVGTALNRHVEAAPRAVVNGCVQVYCFLNPCLLKQCPAGTTCSANYCGGCNAECLSNVVPVDVLHTVG